MSASVRGFDLLNMILKQNQEIILMLTALIDETKEVKKINDDQLAELKKPKQ